MRPSKLTLLAHDQRGGVLVVMSGHMFELPYARAREGVTGNQHLARLSRCKRAHIRLLSAPRSERATDTRAIQDYLGHRRSPRPCATPPSRRTASRGSGGTEGPTRGQTKKAHVGRNCTVSAADVGRLGWSRRGS